MGSYSIRPFPGALLCPTIILAVSPAPRKALWGQEEVAWCATQSLWTVNVSHVVPACSSCDLTEVHRQSTLGWDCPGGMLSLKMGER